MARLDGVEARVTTWSAVTPPEAVRPARRDGAVWVRGLLDPRAVDAAAAVVRAALDAQGWWTTTPAYDDPDFVRVVSRDAPAPGVGRDALADGEEAARVIQRPQQPPRARGRGRGAVVQRDDRGGPGPAGRHPADQAGAAHVGLQQRGPLPPVRAPVRPGDRGLRRCWR